MKINEQKLFNVIWELIKQEDIEIQNLNGKGIFFAPELFIAFEIGKAITKNSRMIFDGSNVRWDREQDLGNGGPTDILFKECGLDENLTLIELKLRDTYFSYKADIKKLSHPEVNGHDKYFCVLADSFDSNKDERISKLEAEFKNKIEKVNQKSFKTNQDWYKKQIYCILALFKIIN